VSLLREVGAPKKTVFHCFSGDPLMAEILAHEGWYASFSGTVTFKNSEGLRDALKVMPSSHILVETDTPFLTPTPFRGRPNSPYMIPYTLRSMAETLGSEKVCWLPNSPATPSMSMAPSMISWPARSPHTMTSSNPPPVGGWRGSRTGRKGRCHTDKKLGQNFVHDANTVRKIVAAAALVEGDHVLEVGPGLGSLTLGLLDAGATVTAIEIDSRLAALLPQTIATHQPGGQCTVIEADAMEVKELPTTPTVLVANLPYNTAVPIVLHLLRTFPTLRRVLVMVQSEVAERLAAHSGSKAYGSPSVKAGWFGLWSVAAPVSRHVFWPIPNVDSLLVAMDATEPPGDEALRKNHG